MTKQQIICSMLARFNEARETLNGPGDIRGDGNSVTLMPSTWNDSYRELERCLLNLRNTHKPLYAHIQERYLAQQPFNEIVRKVEVNHRGNLVLPANTVVLCVIDRRKNIATARLRRWHPWVRREKINEAVDILASEFRGEPFLAPELRDRYPVAA